MDSQALLDSGQVGQVMGLSVGAAVAGRDTAWQGAQDAQASDVERHRGARESSPEDPDGNTVGPHQLRHTSLHSTTLLLHTLLSRITCISVAYWEQLLQPR